MRVVVLVPRRADRGHRDEVWKWCRRQLEQAWPWPIFEGHHDEGVWNQPGATEIVGLLWQIPVGFVFVDGSHSYEGCSLDAKTWGRWLCPGGLMAFHDVTIPDIARAIGETLEGDFDEVEPCNTVRALRKAP